MATRLDGRQLAAELELRLQAVIAERLQRAGRPPGLAVLRVGDDPASGVYVANKEKACGRIGIRNLGAHLAADTPAAAVLASIEKLNADPAVDGILLQLPLPAGLDSGPLLEAIDPEKDADGLHTLNLGRLLKGGAGAAQLHAGWGDGIAGPPGRGAGGPTGGGGGPQHFGGTADGLDVAGRRCHGERGPFAHRRFS